MNLEDLKINTNRNILKFAVPSIIAMILSALVTVVDGYFIGNYVGDKGISAVNLGLPIVYIYLSIGIMIGVGGISIAGRLLGGQKNEEANQVFNQTTITSLIISLLLSLIFILSFSSLLRLLSVDVEVVSHMKAYFYIMFATYALMTQNIVFGMFIRGEGKPEQFMKINIITVFLNIILDYIFISVLHMGIQGIAFASVMSVTVGSLLMFNYFYKHSKVFKFKRFVFSKSVLRETMYNGSSELISQMAQAISIAVYNYVLLKYLGIEGIAAFTIISYAAYIFNMIVIGFGQGASPLMSYTYGANHTTLSQKIRKITSRYVILIGLIFFIGIQLGGAKYSMMFVKSKQVNTIIQEGAKLFSLSFLMIGINIIGSFYFTSIGKAKESALISGMRGLVLLLASVIILPLLYGSIGIWLAAPLTEALTLMITLYLISKDHQKLQFS